jgi:hypothetical protein
LPNSTTTNFSFNSNLGQTHPTQNTLSNQARQTNSQNIAQLSQANFGSSAISASGNNGTNDSLKMIHSNSCHEFHLKHSHFSNSGNFQIGVHFHLAGYVDLEAGILKFFRMLTLINRFISFIIYLNQFNRLQMRLLKKKECHFNLMSIKSNLSMSILLFIG